MTCCPQDCNVFLRAIKKEKHRKKVAAKWAYQVTIEENDDVLELVMDEQEKKELISS